MKKIKLNDIVKVNQSGEWGTGLKEGEIGTKVIRTADFNNDGSINYDNVIFRNIQQKKIDEKKLIYGDIIIEKSGGLALELVTYPVPRTPPCSAYCLTPVSFQLPA